VRPDDGTWSFEGAPVVSGQDVFVAMRESDVMPRLYVACFDAATGRRQWRTSIAAADTPAAGRGGEITHTLLTLVGESIFVNSNLGVIAALDAAEGQVRWLRRYDRTSRTLSAQLPTHFQRDPSPCVYDRGALYVAPADTAAVFALDAETGAVIWSVHSLADMTTLLGVVDGVLIAGGNRLGGVDARSGHVRYIWPESQHAGVRGFGRGVVAGSEVFWPTRDRIYVCDATTGRQSRQPIDITPYSECGANLIAAGGRLIIAGTKQLVALGPQKASPQQSPADNQSDTVAERDGDTALPTSGDS
jgi:outer membrane protein assembly factor BamB